MAEEELQAMYRHHIRDHIKAKKASGFIEALAASGKATEDADAMLLTLSKVRPCTKEVAAALLDYMGSIVENARTLHGNYCWPGRPMGALAEALKSVPALDRC